MAAPIAAKRLVSLFASSRSWSGITIIQCAQPLVILCANIDIDAPHDSNAMYFRTVIIGTKLIQRNSTKLLTTTSVRAI